MDTDTIHEALSEINERFDAGEHARSLALAQTLKAEMLSDTQPCDPMLLRRYSRPRLMCAI